MLLGEEFSARQALDWGLVNSVVSSDKLLHEARRMALRTASLSRDAVAKTKRMMVISNHSTLGDSLRTIDRMHPGQGADLHERIQKLFARSSKKSKL